MNINENTFSWAFSIHSTRRSLWPFKCLVHVRDTPADLIKLRYFIPWLKTSEHYFTRQVKTHSRPNNVYKRKWRKLQLLKDKQLLDILHSLMQYQWLQRWPLVMDYKQINNKTPDCLLSLIQVPHLDWKEKKMHSRINRTVCSNSRSKISPPHNTAKKRLPGQ